MLKRVSVYFYSPIDSESVLYRGLRDLFFSFSNPHSIGTSVGFGAGGLTWKEAHTLAAKVAVTVLKTESESVFDEMRLLVQNDVPES